MQTMYEEQDDGLKDLLAAAGLGEQQQPAAPAAAQGPNPAEALKAAAELGLDVDWLVDELGSDGEYSGMWADEPLGTRILNVARYAATEDALLSGEFGRMAETSGGNQEILSNALNANSDLIDPEELVGWMQEAAQQLEEDRIRGVSSALQDAIDQRPEIANNPHYRDTVLEALQSVDAQDQEDAAQVIDAAVRFADEEARAERLTKFDQIFEAALPPSQRGTPGRDIWDPSPDEDEVRRPDFESVINPPKKAAVDVDEVFSAIEERDRDWQDVQRRSQDLRAEQLAREANIGGRDIDGGRDLGDEWS